MRNAGILSYDTSLESIDFQGNAFHKALTEAIKKCYGNKVRTKVKANWFDLACYDKILSIIKIFTNIKIKLVHTDDKCGMGVMMPTVNSSHIFWHNELKQLFIDYEINFANDSDMKKVLTAMDKKILEGSVDINKSNVHGVYERIESLMFFPIEYFDNDKLLSAEETAAIILHEVGHVFTTYEFVDRAVTTNQVLAGVCRTLDKNITTEQRKVIFTTASNILKMSKDQQEALDKSQDYKQLSVIVLDASIQLSVSELGKNVYDVNSCEQLADQFCNRHGGGRYIVTALDKLNQKFGFQRYPGGLFFLGWAIATVIFIIANIIVIAAYLGAFLTMLFIIMVAGASPANEIYDRPLSRFTRIKLDNIERLKNKDISKDEKLRLIEDNVIIDRCIKVVNDNNEFIEIIAYYLKPSYRNAQKYNNLQKELEKLSSNDLFQASAKLSTI
jgi:hypothetical protein